MGRDHCNSSHHSEPRAHAVSCVPGIPGKCLGKCSGNVRENVRENVRNSEVSTLQTKFFQKTIKTNDFFINKLVYNLLSNVFRYHENSPKMIKTVKKFENIFSQT